jgi:uncharacterized membrane protein
MEFKHTKLQIALEIAGFLFMVGMIIFVCIQFKQLPDKIPAHYNIMGEVDRWGSKSEIIILPIMSTLLYALLTTLTFLPKTWGLPIKITDLNREAVYSCTRSLLIFMKIEILGMFFYITYFMVVAQALPVAFVPLLLLIVIGTSIYFVTRMYQIGKRKG